MMQAMKGATGVLGSMNRSMNLPALQRIAMEFEKENDIMDQRQEMMDDAIDDVTMEDEAEEDEIVDSVLEEIGIDLKAAVSYLTDLISSLVLIVGVRWVKLRSVFKIQLYRKARLHKPSVVVVVIREIMTSKLGSTV